MKNRQNHDENTPPSNAGTICAIVPERKVIRSIPPKGQCIDLPASMIRLSGSLMIMDFLCKQHSSIYEFIRISTE